MAETRYWIAVVSKDHAQRAVSGGFMQVCHGKKAPLSRMKAKDWLIVYSPKESLSGDKPCRNFTAIGEAADHDVFQFQMSADFIPFRRRVTFHSCRETSILPLIPHLDFIQNKKSWGYPFRFGFFEIQEKDFNLIASKLLEK